MGHIYSRPSVDAERGEDMNYLFDQPREVEQFRNNLNGIGDYLALYKAAIIGDWNIASRFLSNNPEALAARITIASETALHIAVGTGHSLDFVDSLIRRMTPYELTLTDQNGETALSVAAIVGNIQAAKLLVHKNPDLPCIHGNHGYPVHRAAQFGQREMICYLLDLTNTSGIQPSPLSADSGARLLNYIITAEFFDIALYLIELYPDIATVDVQGIKSPLHVLASKSHVFPSGYDVSWYTPLHHQTLFRVQRYHCAKELVKRLCLEILHLDDNEAFYLFTQPLLTAANLGTPEIIEVIVEAFPYAIWTSDEENRNIFQLAVLHRQENVYNLIYQISDLRHLITKKNDKHGNNILHLAGQLPHEDRLTLNSRAALQVQRELQWFQEVKKFVSPFQKEATNNEGYTPWMVFKKTHQELITAGGKWMKNTASACTVASTLITTASFGAAVKVPGDKSFNGDPVSIHGLMFGAFVTADAISLFSSIIALLSFLSIVTSRFSVQEFLVSLPKRLIYGLVTLFISMISMTIAFSSAIYLWFGSMKAAILVLVGASVVLVNLSLLMLPLLIRYYKATYGCGYFDKKSDVMLH